MQTENTSSANKCSQKLNLAECLELASVVGYMTNSDGPNTACRAAMKTRTADVATTGYPPSDEGRQISTVGRDHAVTETPSSLACTGCAQKNTASEDWPACQRYGQSAASQRSLTGSCSLRNTKHYLTEKDIEHLRHN